MEVWQIAVVCVVGFIANFFGVVTGGAGIVTTLTMYAFGMDLRLAVGTSRTSNFGVDVTSLYVFSRAGRVDYRIAIPLAVVVAVTALASAQFLEVIPQEVLRRLIGGMILFLVVLAMAFPEVGVEKKKPRRGVLAMTIGYASLVVSTALVTIAGGGAGAFFTYILVFIFGQNYLNAAGSRKILGFALTLMAAGTYLARGLVVPEVAIPLLVSSGFGGWLGSKFMIRRGLKRIRLIFLVGITLTALWLLIGFGMGK